MNDPRTLAPDDSLSEEAALSGPAASFRIALPNFEGPLDLLLHLIREHKLDIFDIPIALITEKYLEQLDRMKEINLDIAGEFLVMAATLAHIKSRLLLPRHEQPAGGEADAPEQTDPRAELVRRLLEYQKYKEVAEQLGRRSVLDRDVFARHVELEGLVIPAEQVGLVEISVYKLIEALDRVLKARVPESSHEVIRERISLSAAMTRITELLREKSQVEFTELFEGQRLRQTIVITFLALLELCKLKLLRVSQEPESLRILICAREGALGSDKVEVDESEYR